MRRVQSTLLRRSATAGVLAASGGLRGLAGAALCGPTPARLKSKLDTGSGAGDNLGTHTKLGMSGYTHGPYNRNAEAFIDAVAQALEEHGDALEDLDVRDGVLTIETVKDGTWVVNKQAPKMQLWLSSPVSGPHHYDMAGAEGAGPADVKWLSERDGHDLAAKLRAELGAVVGKDLTFTL